MALNFDKALPPTMDNLPQVADYLFFCSEHPSSPGHHLSNWFNQGYVAGSYQGEDGQLYWCSEQELMVSKLRFCRNKELADKQRQAIMDMQPMDDPDWEVAWMHNHDLASKMKNACRSLDLQLDVDAWDEAKYNIMVSIIASKYCSVKQPAMAELLRQTGKLVLVEAAHYDNQFGVGLQAGVHRPRCKADKANKSILELDDTGHEVWRVPPGPEWGLNLLGQALMEVRSKMQEGCIDAK